MTLFAASFACVYANPPTFAVESDDLLGSWEGCDGRIVTFTLEDDQYVGRYTELGGLGWFHFTENEIGYTATQAVDGEYVGQVSWRSTSGTQAWHSNTIQIEGDQYFDTGSDACSTEMIRTSESVRSR
ncbi:MAG: hypothetical protein AAGF01_29450 [Cyanobacteria bacterium P01_G01_bin.38]